MDHYKAMTAGAKTPGTQSTAGETLTLTYLEQLQNVNKVAKEVEALVLIVRKRLLGDVPSCREPDGKDSDLEVGVLETVRRLSLSSEASLYSALRTLQDIHGAL